MRIGTLLEEYRKYLTGIRGVRDSTARAYIGQLRKFLGSKTEAKAIGEAELMGKMNELRGRCAVNTRRKLVSALKGFYAWAEFQHQIPNITSRLATVKEWIPAIDVIRLNEVEKMIATAGKDNFIQLRNAAIICVFADTGIRVSELVNLKLKDISWEEQQCLMMVQPSKGNKSRYIPFCTMEEGSLVAEYFNYYYATVKFKRGWGPDDYLFQREPLRWTRDGDGWKQGGAQWFDPGPLSAKGVWSMVKQLAARAGIERRVTPHSFRHFYATYLAVKKVDPIKIMQRLGHAKLDRTMLYIHYADIVKADSAKDNPLTGVKAGWKGGVKVMKAVMAQERVKK